jgi:hypothetical protein
MPRHSVVRCGPGSHVTQGEPRWSSARQHSVIEELTACVNYQCVPKSTSFYSNHITSQQSWPTLPRLFSDIYGLYQCPTVKHAASLACRTLLHNLGSPCHFTWSATATAKILAVNIFYGIGNLTAQEARKARGGVGPTQQANDGASRGCALLSRQGTMRVAGLRFKLVPVAVGKVLFTRNNTRKYSIFFFNLVTVKGMKLLHITSLRAAAALRDHTRARRMPLVSLQTCMHYHLMHVNNAPCGIRSSPTHVVVAHETWPARGVEHCMAVVHVKLRTPPSVRHPSKPTSDSYLRPVYLIARDALLASLLGLTAKIMCSICS